MVNSCISLSDTIRRDTSSLVSRLMITRNKIARSLKLLGFAEN